MPDFRATNLIADAEVFAQSILNVRDWANLLNKPTSFTPSAHTHSAADITTGTFTVGTFATDVIASVIRRDTADGADSSFLNITGAGAPDANRGAYLGLRGNEHTTQPGSAILSSGEVVGSYIDFYSGVTRAGRITGGILAWGTTVTAGAAAGDVVLAHGKWLRSVNGAGTTTRSLVRWSDGNGVTIGDGADAISIGSPPTISGATSGEMVLAVGKYIRATNAAGTGTTRVIAGSTIGGNDMVAINPDVVGVVAIGAVTTVAGAAAGDVLIANAKSIRSANAAGNGTLDLIKANGSDQLVLGAGLTRIHLDTNGTAMVLVGTSNGLGASAGDVVLMNTKALRGVNAAGTGTFPLIQSTSNNSVVIGDNARAVAIGGEPASWSGVAVGDLVMGNGKVLRGVNGAGTGTFEGVRLNGNSVQIAVDAGTGNPGLGVNAVAPLAGETAVFIHYYSSAGASYQRVTVGGVDSAGAGYRNLRVPN